MSPIMVNRTLPKVRRAPAGHLLRVEFLRNFAGHMDKQARVAAWLKLFKTAE